jgi:hypothetical protein
MKSGRGPSFRSRELKPRGERRKGEEEEGRRIVSLQGGTKER